MVVTRKDPSFEVEHINLVHHVTENTKSVMTANWMNYFKRIPMNMCRTFCIDIYTKMR